MRINFCNSQNSAIPLFHLFLLCLLAILLPPSLLLPVCHQLLGTCFVAPYVLIALLTRSSIILRISHVFIRLVVLYRINSTTSWRSLTGLNIAAGSVLKIRVIFNLVSSWNFYWTFTQPAIRWKLEFRKYIQISDYYRIVYSKVFYIGRGGGRARARGGGELVYFSFFPFF